MHLIETRDGEVYVRQRIIVIQGAHQLINYNCNYTLTQP